MTSAIEGAGSPAPSMLDIARDHAALGYPAFPLQPRRKVPFGGTKGFHDATLDEAKILHAWDLHPDANVGIYPAAVGGFILDLDPKEGLDPEDFFGDHDLDSGELVVVWTGVAPEPDEQHPDSLGGVIGAHLYFAGKHPTAKTAVKGAEVRGVGGYGLAPGSIHPCGRRYSGKLPPVADLPPPPPQIVELLTRPSSNGAGAGEGPTLESVPPGGMHEYLTDLAVRLARAGQRDVAVLEAALVAAFEAKRVPGAVYAGSLSDTQRLAKWAVESEIAQRESKRPKPKRDKNELTDFTIPEDILEQLREKGVSDDDIDGVDSLEALGKLLAGGKDSKATLIVKLVMEAGVELFRDPADRTYATFAMGEHWETWPTSSQPFKRYLRNLYYGKYEGAPNAQSLVDALGVLEAKAQFSGDECDVFFRVAGDPLRIVIDLGDPDWRAIEIRPRSWRVLDAHPVKFRRTGGMLPLPMPVPGGSVDKLRPLLNVSDDGWRLVVGWLLAALRPGSPYPILVAHGEQGSAKSTLGRVVRALVDPNSSPLRVAPHDVDDLMVGAMSSWVVAYDNVSRIPPSLSDALCRLSTGGGLSKRQLYTDSDEVLLDAMRPVVLNGIEEIAHRADLLDRALLVDMPVIEEDARVTEEEFWTWFAGVHADVLGGLCDALATALADVGAVFLDRLPRMADLARWVTAAESALGWAPGSFMDVYAGNRAQAHEVALESSALGPALIEVAGAGFSGTMSALLSELATKVSEKTEKSRDWPSSGRALRAELDRLAPNLRALGYDLEHTREPGGASGKRSRIVTVRRRQG